MWRVSGTMCQYGSPSDTSDYENDPDLRLMTEDAEAWSITVDKKVRLIVVIILYNCAWLSILFMFHRQSIVCYICCFIIA